MKNLILAGTVVLSAYSQNPIPPDVTKKPVQMTIHDDTRIDNYYWIRLTDTQKSAKNQDAQTNEVLDYINLENEYTQTSLSHTKNIQDELYNEIVGRIKKDDKTALRLSQSFQERQPDGSCQY